MTVNSRMMIHGIDALVNVPQASETRSPGLAPLMMPTMTAASVNGAPTVTIALPRTVTPMAMPAAGGKIDQAPPKTPISTSASTITTVSDTMPRRGTGSGSVTA